MTAEQLALRAMTVAAERGDLAELRRLAKLYGRQWRRLRRRLKGTFFETEPFPETPPEAPLLRARR